MAKITVYYDYFDGEQKPIWHVVKFKDAELDWSKNTIYIPISAPFQLQASEDFDDAVIGISVIISDLVVNASKLNSFGINLNSIRQRLLEQGVDPDEVLQFVTQIGDIEEVMQLKTNFVK